MATLQPRPYTIEEYTRTVCPACFESRARRADEDPFCDGMLVSEGGKIWMRRWCPEHGESASLYEEDAELWRARAGWQTPTLAITPDRPGLAGFPDGYREGLPASHGQHSCILLLNITQNCNYGCPTCFASALSPGTAKEAVDRPTREEILHTVRTVIEREGGRLSVLMLSGGEPTVRKDLPELLDVLSELPITRILINTNGRRIARDDKFLALLEKLKNRIEIYLQFDGLEESTYLHLRAEPLVDEKMETLRRLKQAGIFTTLVTTVKQGVNEHELGSILKLALDSPQVSGWAIQPVFGSGRNSGIDSQNRITPTGVMRHLEQTKLMQASDFIPLPCSHRDCCDIAYLVKDRSDRWRSIVDLIGRERLKDWIHIVSNTISFENASETLRAMIGEGILQRVFSEQQATSSLKLAADLYRMCDCIPGVTDLVSALRGKAAPSEDPMTKALERTLRITVKMFMDAHTFHDARIRQCCVHTGTFEEDPRRYSFCWRWLFEDAEDFPSAGLTPLKVV